MSTFGLKKAERLRSKTKIQDLFNSGKTIKTPQIKMIYKRVECDQNADHLHMVIFSAPKKQYPKASKSVLQKAQYEQKKFNCSK